jgi:4-amino-4-deoxy-L-arabinose transferase-like glycosyltransferase
MKNPDIVVLPARQVAIVAVMAGLIRIAYRLLSTDSLFLETPVVDASFFDIWARALADGRVFQAQVFFKPPLQAYLLSWLYQLGFGMTEVQILQMLAGVVTCVLVLGVGRLAFGARVGLAGAAVTALLPIFAFFENQLLAEPWTGLLTAAALLLLMLAISGRGGPVTRSVVAAGFLLGLAALGRPNLMLPAVAVAVWFGWTGRRKKGPGLGTGVAFLIGFVIGIAPATLHNLKYGELVAVSANLGPNLVAGHSDRADGVSAIPVGVLWDDLQLQARQAGARGPADASRLLTRQAGRWVVENPGRTVQLLGKKLLLLVNAREGRNNINPRWMAEEEGVFLLGRWWPGTWLVIPFALVGLIFTGRGHPSRMLLVWFLIALAVSMLPFFVNARFRLPMLPVLALFAASGGVWLFDRWRAGARRALAVPLAVLALSFVVSGVDWFGLGDDRWLARDHFNHGYALGREYDGRQPDLAGAERSFRRALELDPDDVDANEHLGAFLLQRARPHLTEGNRREAQGDLAEAARAYEPAGRLLAEAGRLQSRAIELYPRSVKSWLNRGVGRMWRGDLESFAVRRALAAGDTTGARGPGLAALQFYRDAVGDFQKGLEVDPSQRDARRYIQVTVEALRRLPDVAPAITDFKRRLPATDAGRR